MQKSKGFEGTGWMKKAIWLFLLLCGGMAWGQNGAEIRSDNGWHMSPRGRLHILLVFAEIDFDSTFQKLDPTPEKGMWRWASHQLPVWKDDLIAKNPKGDAFMTKYFRQASFGEFQVTGDYLDTLVKVKITDIRDRNGNVVTQEAFGNNLYKRALLKQVNDLEQPRFAYGSRMEDFDRWTFGKPGQKNLEEGNGKIDLVMVIWRNIHVANLGDHSGFVTPGNFGEVFGKQTDMYSIFRASDAPPTVICRHEFSHMLYGGNNFHTANGGVGTRMFIPTVGGYSNMSASDALSQTWNGWDRERMGWKNPDNKYLVNAICASTGQQVSGELVYGEALCGDGTYVLRDFASTGDVLKIKLPHLPDGVRNQYLWLENHQMEKGYIDHDEWDPKGLYGYVQVGKDLREGSAAIFGDNCNYLWPLAAQGNYDFELTGPDKSFLHLRDTRQNPFTGYNYLMRIVNDKNGDGKIRITQDINPKTEYTLPNKLVVNRDTMPESFFSYQEYPIFGTQETAFRPELHNKISIARNPAPTPVYTFSGNRPSDSDNRRIYLNGISVEVLELTRKGDMRLRVRWDDFDIDRHVRWCGDILSLEQVNVLASQSITLDQGYTPQEPVVVQKFRGESIFAQPTVLEIAPGSVWRLGQFAKVWVSEGSSLVIRKGSRVEIGKNASIEVEPGAYVYIEEGAEIDYIHRSGRINVRGNSPAINPLVADGLQTLGPPDARF